MLQCNGGGACAGSTHERRIFRSLSKHRLEVGLGSLRCDNLAGVMCYQAMCVEEAAKANPKAGMDAASTRAHRVAGRSRLRRRGTGRREAGKSHRVRVRQSKRKTLGGNARACPSSTRSRGERRCEHPARTPPVSWHEFREKDATNPDPFAAHARRCMHARRHVRKPQKACAPPARLHQSRSKRGGGKGGVPKRLRLCDNTPPLPGASVFPVTSGN